MVKELKTISRTLRTRDDDSESDPYSDELNVSSPSVLDTGSGFEDDDEGEEDPAATLQRIPFAELAKAQQSLATGESDQSGKERKKRKRGAMDEGKLSELRARIQELREKKTDGKKKQAGGSKLAAVKHRDDDDGSSDDQGDAGSFPESGSDAGTASENSDGSDSENSEEEDDQPRKKRRSKHAPTEVTSKRQVKRRIMDLVSGNKTEGRDPRFMPGIVQSTTATVTDKRYAFLDDIRQKEMNEIRDRLRQDKAWDRATPKQRRKMAEVRLSSGERDDLTMQLRRMEDQARSRKEKARIEEVTNEHMKKEKELVRSGKKAAPFYLKQADIKRLATEKKFGEMKARDRDRAIDRRRKKLSAKEKKAMPADRRQF